ncbi:MULTISPECIES: hypothetical protein [unclassified Streptomyces]|uniref:hypothetical protein n=1 Tax=unclassified Streptomyces TaxID=2593676 RepID=UPI0037FAC5D9
MRSWDFDEWRVALGAVDPRAAALVGLAAAERISGALGDARFRRHGDAAAETARHLLDLCWTGILAGDDASRARLHVLADQLADRTGAYVRRTLTEQYGTTEGPDGHAGGTSGETFAESLDGAFEEALEEALEEAELAGAVMLHVDALTALSEAASACAGGPWDGALRCLQTTAMAISGDGPGQPGPGAETRRQYEDLALLRAVPVAGLDRAAAELRVRAQAVAPEWRRAAERLDLLDD